MAPEEETVVQPRSGIERLKLFTDALLGIIMTLLVVELVTHLEELSGSGETVVEANNSVKEWVHNHLWFFPSHLASFLVLMYLWRRHHELFRYFDNYTRLTAWLNAGFMLVICLVPFATALMARSELRPLSLVVFFATFSVALSFLLVILEHGHRTRRLVLRDPEVMTALRWFLWVPLGGSLLCLAIAGAGVILRHEETQWVFGAFILMLVVAPLAMRKALSKPRGEVTTAEKEITGEPEEVREDTSRRSTLGVFFDGSNPERTLAFSDGVYAIALTMMAVQLTPDEDHLGRVELHKAVRDAFSFDFGDPSSFAFFALQFVLLMMMWFLHVKIFSFKAPVDSRTQWFNAFHLCFIVWSAVAFGLLIDSSKFASIPWWFMTAVLLLAALLLYPVIWDVYVRRRQRGQAAERMLRYVSTKVALISVAVPIVFAPLGLLRLAIPLLLVLDPLVNLFWRADGSRRTLRTVLFVEPVQRPLNRFSWMGVWGLLALVVAAVLVGWWNNQLWLLQF